MTARKEDDITGKSEYGDMNDDEEISALTLLSVPPGEEGKTDVTAVEEKDTAVDDGKNGEGNEVSEESEKDGEDEDYKHQPKFVCCCGASFQFLGQITSHKKKACQWIYVCPHCDRVYKDFDKMEVHKKTHITVKSMERAKEIVAEPLKKDVTPVVEANKPLSAAATVAKVDTAENKTDTSSEAKTIPKVERNLPKKTLIVKPPPIIRPKGPNFPQGGPGILGNRPNFMQNQGMMNPGFQGGFNHGMGMMNPQMGMMNTQMGMGNCGPMNMGMGMGNFGPNMCGPNMMGGMNMGMNMMPNMGNFGPNMGGPNMMGMGGMNMGMNNMGMGNFGPNMGGNFGPMGMNHGRNMGGGPNIGPSNISGGPKHFLKDDLKSEVKRGRELSPPGRRSPLRRSLSPRRRESRSPPPGRDSPRRDTRSRDEYSTWRDSSRDRSRDRDENPFRRDNDRPDRPDRPSPWAQRSMTREEFLSSNQKADIRETPFPKSDLRDDPFPKDYRSDPFTKDRRDDAYSRDYRDYSPRDDGPPGLGKYGISSGSYKRESSDPISRHPAKMLRPF